MHDLWPLAGPHLQALLKVLDLDRTSSVFLFILMMDRWVAEGMDGLVDGWIKTYTNEYEKIDEEKKEGK